jgi:branched-chain amino acid transport system ATP-binding protein
MLDEPSLGLAPIIVEHVYALLGSIREDGVAILLVEQNAERAFALAERAYVMSAGRFVLAGTPAALASDAKFDAAYFGIAMRERGASA